MPKQYSLYKKIIFFTLIVICLTPIVSAPIALLLGILAAQFVGHPYPHLNQKATSMLLQVSVVGLGFGMNANTVMEAGKEGIMFTFISIIGTLILGIALGKMLKVDSKTSYLISAGTAICGGSAIAAVSPVIKAEEKQISIALGTIFILNSAALFIFPWIGDMFHLSQKEFGIWSAIAIHDTSSVVGAASNYGSEALQIATTIKLTRALWIIPVAIISGLLYKSKDSKIKIPYFISFFVLAIVLNTYIPFVQNIGSYIYELSKIGLTLTLFLIGSGLSKKNLTSVGIKPVLHGIILWIVISIVSLFVILL